MRRLVFSTGFKKQYKKLPRKTQKRVDERLDLFAHDPHHGLLGNHVLTGEYKEYRSINISGDMRAIYEEIKDDVAYFIGVGTHHDLYGS